MPTPPRPTRRYRCHNASGRTFVRIKGLDFQLSAYGQTENARLIAKATPEDGAGSCSAPPAPPRSAPVRPTLASDGDSPGVRNRGGPSLGQARADVTEIYVENNLKLAIDVARETG